MLIDFFQLLFSECEKQKREKNIALFSLFVVPPGIEPGTHGFSVHCSTN
jgi:hypothetical protein